MRVCLSPSCVFAPHPLPGDFYLSISLLSVISSPLPMSLLGQEREALKGIFVVLGNQSKKKKNLLFFPRHPAWFQAQGHVTPNLHSHQNKH